jgi:RNA recognition motif-containing protein
MMSKKIYVGNLPPSATEDEVRALFERHGTVHSVTLITDRDTGRPRGFGFVEMDDAAAEAAIAALANVVLGDRNLTVNEARPRPGGSGDRKGRGRW